MSYQALFFDFDGVLVDSVQVKTRAFAKLFHLFDPKIQAKVVVHHRKSGGRARRDKFRYYYAEFLKKPLDNAEMDRLCNAFSSLVIDEVVSSLDSGGREISKKMVQKA